MVVELLILQEQKQQLLQEQLDHMVEVIYVFMLMVLVIIIL